MSLVLNGLIAEVLDVPTGAAADKIRQMLDEKIRTMGYEPSNIQVVVEGKNDALYLINEIKCIESTVVDHVQSDDVVDDVTQGDELG